jgi:hypothetical protein
MAADESLDLTARWKNPTVRGESVTILGPKPDGYTGLGYLNGDILVVYPDGEQGCVSAADIREGS